MRSVVAGVFASVMVCAGPASAQQPAAPPRVEVLVIEAGAGDAGVAAALANIPQLRLAPFNTFGQLRLVSRATLPLGAAPASTALPNGRVATVTLASRSPENRYTVNVGLTGAASVQFVAGVGEPFFTVRSSRADRALILGFIVRN